MIPRGEIFRMAHRLNLGDKTIEQDYVLTWVLLAIANTPLRDRLAFKGGTAIKKIYEPDYRFSEDLDFTLLDDTPNEALIAEIECLFPWLRREVNMTLAVRKVETHESGNPALYLNYVGPLRGDLSSRFFKTDFTRDEMLLFPLVEAPLQVPYSDCQDRTETLRVYSMEEILTEKLCALLGRTEPRDLYDVKAWVEPQVDRKAKTVRFMVKTGKGKPPDPPKVSRGAKFRCLVCGEVAPDQHLKDEGMAGRMGAQLMAVVTEGKRRRNYYAPALEHEQTGR